MKHVSILIPNGRAVLMPIIGTYNLLNQANEYLINKGQDPCFRIQLVGLSSEVKLFNGLISINSEVLLGNLRKSDLIIIPAFEGELNEQLRINEDFIPWIVDQYNSGAEIASLCFGAFLLAQTGLLNGKKCSTHWAGAASFQKMFPEVELQTEKIITEDNGIYSSGGAYSFLNLILYLIQKYCGPDAAIYCSKIEEIDIDRRSQSPFIIFKGQKQHNDEEIIKCQAYIENNYEEKILIPELAKMFSMSHRNLERRFKSATDCTPIEYLQRVRIEAAKRIFESSAKSTKEVMYSVGFSDDKAFRNIFSKMTNISPYKYQKVYRRLSQTISNPSNKKAKKNPEYKKAI
jgi:transcriptional regulator GlxA family with amidase domain